MKLKSLCMAMVVMGLSTTFAHAADGTLKFKGSIGSSTCTISGAANSTIEVPMGVIPKETLQKNAIGPEVGFAINLTNCDPGKYYLVLDGVSPAGQENVLQLDDPNGGDTAKGVGIQIKDISDNNITLSKSLSETDAHIEITGTEKGGGTFFLKANYYAFDQSALTTGTADATATFTIIQQ